MFAYWTSGEQGLALKYSACANIYCAEKDPHPEPKRILSSIMFRLEAHIRRRTFAEPGLTKYNMMTERMMTAATMSLCLSAVLSDSTNSETTTTARMAALEPQRSIAARQYMATDNAILLSRTNGIRSETVVASRAAAGAGLPKEPDTLKKKLREWSSPENCKRINVL